MRVSGLWGGPRGEMRVRVSVFWGGPREPDSGVRGFIGDNGPVGLTGAPQGIGGIAGREGVGATAERSLMGWGMGEYQYRPIRPSIALSHCGPIPQRPRSRRKDGSLSGTQCGEPCRDSV